MKQLTKLYLFLLFMLAGGLSIATVLPEDQDFIPASQIVRPIDASLQDWKDAHVARPNAVELPAKQYMKLRKSLDEVARQFVDLRRAATEDTDSTTIIKRTMAKLGTSEFGKQFGQHLLMPYLLEELIESSSLDQNQQQMVYKLMQQYGGRSCPNKEVVLKDLDTFSGNGASVDQFRKIFAKITAFQSKRFRKEALESFLDSLPQKYQGNVRQELYPVVTAFPELVEDNQWLVAAGDSASIHGIGQPFKSLREAENQAGKRRCRTAKMKFLRAVKLDKDAKHFDEAKATADVLERCFRRKGRVAREKYWAQIRSGLEKAYGFKGVELTERKIGLLAWSRDDFVTARAKFRMLISRSKKAKEPGLEGESIFTLARIEENDSKLSVSLDYYRDYTTRFKNGERYLEALKAMVLLYAITGKLQQSLKSAQAIIDSQSVVTIDKTVTGTLSFALFWAGRLHFSLGNKKIAREMWRRVASEYYSTFYGALGHFVLEKVAGKHLELAPFVGKPFAMKDFLSYYDPPDRRVLETASALLKLGLRDEAVCELSEVVIADEMKEKILVKALYQHASGEWLASIINFSNLPRSFRHGLPIGFERILFPRAFVSSIEGYAKKLGLDPDLVFAIIRQESVFNPKAISGAGARGLMQLMPGTARVESKRLSSAYLPRSRRSKLRREVRDRRKLLEPETNLALGVHHVHRLLSKYRNPIYALTSYNANPRATQRWVQNLPTADALAFIERIPYRETQAYVKLVLRNYFYYKRWYHPPTLKLPHLDYLAKNVMEIAGKKQKKSNN